MHELIVKQLSALHLPPRVCVPLNEPVSKILVRNKTLRRLKGEI